MRQRGLVYVPYIKLPSKNRKSNNNTEEKITINKDKEIESNEVITPKNNIMNNDNFTQILYDCGCEISKNDLKSVLDVLSATNELKDAIITIASNTNQQALLDLEQMLNVAERKLQHDWEYSNFMEENETKFKAFLNWRRLLKGAIFFWKKLYSSNAILELQKAWTAYTADPTEKSTLANEKTESSLKRYQISTETFSTIFNTRKPFTRVFYATSKEVAYEQFTKWISDRQLHENKSKTTVVEL